MSKDGLRIPRIVPIREAQRRGRGDVCRGRTSRTRRAALNGSDGVAEKTRGEILRIASELGYQADPRAQFLRRSHTGLIGASFAIGQAYQGLIVDGLFQAASALEHALVLATSTPHRDVADGLRSLLLQRCEGLILVDPDLSVDALAGIGDRPPAVLIGTSVEMEDVDEVHSRGRREGDRRGATHPEVRPGHGEPGAGARRAGGARGR